MKTRDRHKGAQMRLMFRFKSQWSSCQWSMKLKKQNHLLSFEEIRRYIYIYKQRIWKVYEWKGTFPFRTPLVSLDGTLPEVPSKTMVSAADASAEMRQWLMGLDAGKGAVLEYHGSISRAWIGLWFYGRFCRLVVGWIENLQYWM